MSFTCGHLKSNKHSFLFYSSSMSCSLTLFPFIFLLTFLCDNRERGRGEDYVAVRLACFLPWWVKRGIDYMYFVQPSTISIGAHAIQNVVEIPWNQILNETEMISSKKMCFKGMPKINGATYTPPGRHEWRHLMHTSGRVNVPHLNYYFTHLYNV